MKSAAQDRERAQAGSTPSETPAHVGESRSNASAASVAFTADPIAVVVYDYGSKISDDPTITVFGPFGGWNEANAYRDKIRAEREPECVVMRDPSIWPEPEKAL